jgi:hypothetical protein
MPLCRYSAVDWRYSSSNLRRNSRWAVYSIAKLVLFGIAEILKVTRDGFGGAD